MNSRNLAMVMLAAGLVALPLDRGGLNDWASLWLGLCSGIAVICASTRPRSVPLGTGAWLSLLLSVTYLAWLALMVVPLPEQILAEWFPMASQTHSSLLAAGAPSCSCISLSPALSQQAWLRSMSYFSLYLAIVLNLRSQQDVRLLLGVLVMIALAQAILGAVNLYGVWEHPLFRPENAHRGVATGSFANRNHYAAYLYLGAAACLMLMFSQSSSTSGHGWRARLRDLIDWLGSLRSLLRLSLLALLISIILTQSRMGNAAVALGLSSFALLWLLSTRDQRSFGKALLIFLSIAVLDVLIISERFGLAQVMERVQSTDLSDEQRLHANRISKQLIEQTQLRGSGLGSYADLAAAWREPGDTRQLHFAHNDYYQFAIETGLIGIALLGGLCLTHGLLAAHALGRQRSWRRACGAGALMALVATLSHALVEFQMQIPAVAASFTALMGVIASPAVQRRRRRRSKR